jgi:hypothetical protein
MIAAMMTRKELWLGAIGLNGIVTVHPQIITVWGYKLNLFFRQPNISGPFHI